MFRLFRAQLRRDRWQLLYWILGNGLFAAASASALAQEFGNLAERTAILKLASGNPALLAIRGIPDGATEGATVYFEIFTYLALVAALMSTFMTVRHSRGDEEAGRAELIGSTPIARSSALAATLLLGILANVAMVIVVTAGFAAVGLPFGGAAFAGLATGAAGLAFCGVAALAAQLARTSRAANTIAGGLVGVAFLLRAVGDALGTASADGLHVTSTWPSWLSPIGWGQQVRAWGADESLLPLLLSVTLAVLASAVAVVLVRRRDLGSGLVGERAGRATASRTLRGSFGLAWRLQRAGVIGWAVGGVLLGLFAGGLADPAIAAVKDNGDLAAAVQGLVGGGTAGLFDTFVAAIMAFLGILAAGAAIQAVLRGRSEEVDGHSELLLSGAVSKARALLDSILVALLSIVAVLLAGGLAAGLTFIAVGHPDRFGSSLAAAFVQLPAALVFVAASALVFALLPRLTVGLGWGMLTVGFVLGQFGGLLKLPDWLRDVSPFTHTPVVPGDRVDWTPLLVMAAISIAVAAVSIPLARRRDLVS
jgi:ABC-2 type transport system permease protein